MTNTQLQALTTLRKELHRHPELSGEEVETAGRIKAYLEQYPPDELIENLGGTGLAAVYEGQKPGLTVLIRCELDALPIEEINTFAHQSKTNGVSHKCGHDGHMAIICGVAMQLDTQRPKSGCVVLLFQPSEENGRGAAAVLNDNKFQKIIPDYVFALHNLPSYPTNQVVVKRGTFTAAVHSIIIHLKGKTAHAAEPHNGVNPASAIATITQQLLALNVTDINRDDFCIVTPVYIHMGEKAYGVSADSGEAHFTIRCKSNTQMRSIEHRAEGIAKQIAQKEGLKIKISWTESFHANQNNEEAVSWIAEAARENGLEILETKTPFAWGEDFGLFTQNFQGAMFCLGAGEHMPALHNPDYDFPDTLIPAGVNMLLSLIQKTTHV